MKRLRDYPDETEEEAEEWLMFAVDNCECVACQPDLDDRHEDCEEWCFMGAVPVEKDGTRMPVHIFENLSKYQYNPETKEYEMTVDDKVDEMLNEATGVPHYELIIDSIQEHFDNAEGDLVPQDILLHAIRSYGEALEKALKRQRAFRQALIEDMEEYR